ncbi:MAG: DEAD/DEAH box helicase family protein [bacterium]|nr:DEAD/DEAH box helicase family protein [bacterium]
MTEKGVKTSALEPLFLPWDEPHSHRIRAEKSGDPAHIVKGRRSSPIRLAQNIRASVREWRENGYYDASQTSRELLSHWFGRDHRIETSSGDSIEFRYYFCQREAIETLVYLKEVRGLSCLSQLVAEYGGADAELAALGITEDEDAWSRYAFKLATGAGKTKVMTLAVVWSYFHALREPDSTMAKHFVVIAPNLTVYERLKEDFAPGDRRDIFHTDPLIPPEWKGDWKLSVVLQDETSGTPTGGVLYLTNIHRLYDPKKRSSSSKTETYDFMGPAVSKGSALDTAEALRDRITSHPRVMVLNDEAHHVWDRESAWNDALRFLNDAIRKRTGSPLLAQLDFSATPKDDKGQLFKQVVVDTPLGEAVDGGIVKTPVIGGAGNRLKPQPADNAAQKYESHLRLGYERWKLSHEEWQKSGMKPLLFVMCEDTTAADEIAARFNEDETFKELNGRTINLHTNLKGKVKKVGRGKAARSVFVENEKQITDEDLKVLRELSRQLDSDKSPYRCIVSVLMLREGWDVRNVTTIVPLRPLTAKSNILPEQTLGRGLRRMTPPGQANEIVTVIEHPSFASLYQQELAQEGLPIEIIDVDKVPKTTVSIYPDDARKDLEALELAIPRLTAGHRIVPKLEGLSLDDIKKEFSKHQKLPLGASGETAIQYEGRQLITNEIVERMKIHLPLLATGAGAVSYFVKELEQVCKLRGTHAALASLVQSFLEELLFEEKTDIYDPKLVSRLGDPDVSEHIRAVFIPLIRARITTTEERLPDEAPMRLSTWKPFQVTLSETRPVLDAARTLFNLVPCNRGLELAIAEYFDRATDLAAFAANTGPQSLRIDYLALGGRLAFYKPDFFVRAKDGTCYLVETKGREDRDVAKKARAAVAWCEAASSDKAKWEYIYVPQGVFERITGDTLEDVLRTCRPALTRLLGEEEPDELPILAAIDKAQAEADEKPPEVLELVDAKTLDSLPPRYRKAVQQAVMLYSFFENKEGMNYAPAFNALLGSLDESSRGLLKRRLQDEVPPVGNEAEDWFSPYFEKPDRRKLPGYKAMARNLKKTLVYDSGISPLGLLRTCMDFALNDKTKVEGVFASIREKFQVKGGRDVLGKLQRVNDFRNTRVAHQEDEITDAAAAKKELLYWIDTLHTLAHLP